MRKLFAMVLVAALVLTAGAAYADGAKLTVQGSGTVLVESDLAIISLGVREAAKDVLQAQSAVNEKIAAVRKALLDAGVSEKEINTDAIGIYANYDYSTIGTEIIAGYTAYNSLSVRTEDIENIGALIDAAFASGANSLDNVQFTLKDDTASQEEALGMAVQDAMRKSEVLASAAGLKVKGIESIVEGYNYTYDSMRNYRYAAAEDGAGAGTLVQAALVNVSASVTVEFETE
ncbi:MAG: SIMPL domain-containing protein [Clostridiales bacterium]|nr:SIMPL domain-containing protein [Clostridiales bacterium]